MTHADNIANGIARGFKNPPYLAVCPLTTMLSVASVRLRLKANAETGLKEPSDIEIDKVTTIRKNRVSAKIGAVTDKDQAKINYALRVWLDL